MAVLWQKQVRGKRYEVRTAGRALRLYTDGVFHSQYNPTRPMTGSVWDLLTLPAFFYPPAMLKRVLVLGVGGGAVIKQLQHFLAPEAIVGIELSRVHLQIARRFFGLRAANLVLLHEEAGQWLRSYSDAPFDMIIDDLFGEREGQPVRAVDADAEWFGLLVRNLSASGLLVANFDCGTNLRRCGYFANSRIRQQFKSAFRLSTPQNENAVGAFLRRPADSAALRARLNEVPELRRMLRQGGLNYRIRRL